MMALVRREGGNTFGWIGTSRPSYRDWTWHETKHRLGGPNFLRVPDGTLWAVSRSYPGGAKTVLTSTPREIFASTDGGESWRGLGVGKHFRLPYCRSLALKPDEPGVLFVATGDGALGSTGAIQRSKDGGQSWQALPLPVEPNSPIWSFATHPANPNRILACSHYGEIFASENAGDSWVKLRREFSEIRALAWTPN